jgi:hypothetical protein
VHVHDCVWFCKTQNVVNNKWSRTWRIPLLIQPRAGHPSRSPAFECRLFESGARVSAWFGRNKVTRHKSRCRVQKRLNTKNVRNKTIMVGCLCFGCWKTLCQTDQRNLPSLDWHPSFEGTEERAPANTNQHMNKTNMYPPCRLDSSKHWEPTAARHVSGTLSHTMHTPMQLVDQTYHKTN